MKLNKKLKQQLGLLDSDQRPRSARVARLHQMLQDDIPFTARSAGKKLGVCAKTIRSDCKHMVNTLGLPVDFDYSRNTYFYTHKVTYLPTHLITEGNLYLLAVLEQAASCYGDKINKRIQKLFREITSGFGDSYSRTKDDWREIVSIRYPHRSRTDPAYIDALARAAAGRWTLELDYRRPDEKEFRRRCLDPHHICNVNGDWYLFAYAHDRKEIRCFSLLRMKNIVATGERFERQPDFDIDQELDSSFGLHSRQGDHKVVVHAKPRVAAFMHEKEWAGLTDIHDLPDGTAEMHFNLSSLVEIERWILNWGGGLKAIEPATLKTAIAASAKALYDDHSE